MARKTFISYKFSNSQALRDRILKALGDDASYYQGETADSPDLTDTTTENIRKNLTDMMFNTSVTIVILSPSMKESNWIEWELEYCLKEITRNGRTSKTNGIVGVVQKIGGSYDWLVKKSSREDGCTVRTVSKDFLPDIINNNRFNRKESTHSCSSCKTYDQLNDSFISIIDEDDFLKDPQKYIENAYRKAESTDDFKLVKQKSVEHA